MGQGLHRRRNGPGHPNRCRPVRCREAAPWEIGFSSHPTFRPAHRVLSPDWAGARPLDLERELRWCGDLKERSRLRLLGLRAWIPLACPRGVPGWAGCPRVWSADRPQYGPIDDARALLEG